MKSELLAYFHWPLLTAFALVWFIALFIAALVWVFLPKNRRLYQYMASLPVEESTPIIGG